MQASDFCVPVYLNQSVVFDLLAIIEDGLAQVSTIRTSENTKSKAEGGIGASNVFALLGVTLKGERGGESNREVTHERVHTPVSLFAKVRGKLRADRMVQDLSAKLTDLTELAPGSFVELEVKLRRNPLAEALEAIAETISGIAILQAWGKHVQKPQAEKAKEKSQEDQLKRIAEQSKRMLTALRTGGSVDLLGPIVNSTGTALLSVETRYFAENWSDEIGNGRFRVFGKVIQNTAGSEERISLLRNTQFAHMTAAMEPMKEAVLTANKSGLSLPEVVTDVASPALHILPIAIFL